MRMNTKKHIAGLMVCVLVMLLSQCAFAESILPDISQLIPTASEEYPSFSVACDTEPVITRETENNEVVYQYANVTEADYSKFGTVLNEKGYTNEAVEVLTDSVNVTVAKGSNRFSLVYYFLSGKMDVIYPAGAVIEVMTNVSAFKDYIELKKGDIMEIPEFGKMKISDCFMNNDRYTWVYCYYESDPDDYMWRDDFTDLTYSQKKDIFGQLILEGTFTNTSKINQDLNGLYLTSMERDSGVSIYCAYFNGNTSYIFEEGYFGATGEDGNDNDIFYMSHSKGLSKRIPLFKNMNTSPLGIVVDVSEEVQTSKEGILALVIETRSGKYYMKLRENGENL